MKAEIIAIGSELLLGDVINSNAAWISKRLAALGIDVFHHITVGDNPRRIHEVVAQAVERAEILIFTGGLGPTDDDLTVATLADYFQTPLENDPASEESLKAFFLARDVAISPSNFKQALRPVGSIAIANPVGTAPGVFWDASDKTIKADKPLFMMFFPGVPRELYAMWGEGMSHLKAKLVGRGESEQVLEARFLNFFGIGESKLAEKLNDLMNASNPTVAPYVGRAEVRIRIAAKAATSQAAQEAIEPVKTEILSRVGAYYYGEDDETLESGVAQLMVDKGLTVAVAESCTGGLVSSRLTDVPGSSAYTHLNMVTYSNAQKSRQLGVDPAVLETHGAVSPEVAEAMAVGIRKEAGTNIGVSLTGIAGPEGGSHEKPVGLVYIGFDGLSKADSADPIVKRVTVNSRFSRQDIKYWFSHYALHYLKLYILGMLDRDETNTLAQASHQATNQSVG